MKKTTLLLCLLAFALVACKPDPEPEPNNGGQNNDTTETIVKKYLVKECLNIGDSLTPVRIIDWNDDYSKITHITAIKFGNNYYQLDHSFEYFGEDSIYITVTQPQDSWGWPLFTTCTCHLEEGRIVRIDYYRNAVFQNSDIFEYDELGRMIKRKTDDVSVEIQFEWDGKNVIRIKNGITGEILNTYSDFCDHIHPDFTLPYYLFTGDFNVLTQPLWKNGYHTPNEGYHDCDTDGYITRTYFMDEKGDEITLRTYVYSN